MRTALDVFLLVDGLLLIASARILATALKIPGDRSTAVRLLGLGDDRASETYRFATSVIAGLLLVIVAVADLTS